MGAGPGLPRWDGPNDQPERAARLAAMAAFGERAVVKPSRDAVMGFTVSTSVQEVLVSGGQAVKAGELLIRGNDIEDVAEAKFQRARADTELPVDRARAETSLAELEYQRQLEAFNQGAGSQLELDRALVTRDTSRIDLDLALLNQVLSDLQAGRAEARAAKLSLRAPFDGVVDIINVDRGQSVRDGEPVVRVVSVDPLWIDVPVETAMTMTQSLHPGSLAWVLLQEDTAERVYISTRTRRERHAAGAG
jgi:multidrug efflux pump subunit AcrA (membrane-fusion protein)